MGEYRPIQPFSTTAFLLVPEYQTIKNVPVKKYPEQGTLFFCSFRTFGGTETVKNNLLVVEDTAVIETWYKPDIKADCKMVLKDGTQYEIIGTPENINQRNQFMRFKVRRIGGNA